MLTFLYFLYIGYASAYIIIDYVKNFCYFQFEIVDARDYTDVEKLKNKSTYLVKDKDGTINGKPTYARILIKMRK